MNRHLHPALLALPLFVSSPWAQTPATLRDAADAIGLNFGLATNSFQVGNASSAYAVAAAAQFNLAVCENEMKFESTENPIGKFNYSGGDAVYKFVSANKMKMRGHNFVWGGQSSSAQAAVHDRATGLRILKTHIDSVGGHFKTKILEWDVLNEITNDGGSGGLKNIFWKTNIGDDYADSALVFSRRAIGTNGYLYSNDYSADGVNAKSTSILNMATKWIQKGVPIDGIGFQCHLSTGINKADISANIKRFGDLGLRVSLTEIDIKQAKTADWTALMGACLENYNCVSFVTWGLTDASSWIGSTCGCLLYNGSTPAPKTDFINALIDAMAHADPTITAKRKAFIQRTPGTTALYARNAVFRTPSSGWLGAAAVPLYSNGAKGAVDILGRNQPVAPRSPWAAGLGILPQ